VDKLDSATLRRVFLRAENGPFGREDVWHIKDAAE